MGTNQNQIIYQGAANMQYQKNVAAVLGYNKGGQLILTNNQLIFKAHMLNIGQKEYFIPLSAIKVAKNTFHVLTPSPNMIKIELESGEIYKFVVSGKDKDKWKSLILEYAQKARSDTDNTKNLTSTAVKYCNNCGEKLLDKAKFCGKCGSPVNLYK